MHGELRITCHRLPWYLLTSALFSTAGMTRKSLGLGLCSHRSWHLVCEVMAAGGSCVCRQIAMVWVPFVLLGLECFHTVLTYVGNRQERLPGEVALRLHLTMMSEKHFQEQRKSSWRAEDTARGSSRQGQRNTRSTPQPWRTGETINLRDRVETGGGGGH